MLLMSVVSGGPRDGDHHREHTGWSWSFNDPIRPQKPGVIPGRPFHHASIPPGDDSGDSVHLRPFVPTKATDDSLNDVVQ